MVWRILLVELWKCGPVEYLFGFNLFSRRKIWLHNDLFLLLLNGVNLQFRMKYISRPKNTGNPTKSLRNIPNTIINIQIRPFSINSTGHDKFAELLHKAAQLISLLHMLRNRLIIRVLIVAYYVHEIVDYFLVLFCEFLQEWQKMAMDAGWELVVYFGTYLSKSFVELFCWVLVLLDLHVKMENLYQSVQWSQ